MNIFHGSYQPESAFPIRISYHRNTHYNSLVDPEKPTIGVGLGLPGFKPRVSNPPSGQNIPLLPYIVTHDN